MHVAAVTERVLDGVFPRCCEACGEKVGGGQSGHLCWDCGRRLHLITRPYCELCGDPCDGDLSGSYTCALCRRDPPAFTAARSAVRYRGVIQPLVQAFKYNAALHLTRELTGLLEAAWRASLPPIIIDAIVPVPLHDTRRRERSYNQSELLAARLAKRMGRPLLTDCLVRTRPTVTQTGFNAEQRRRNVRGAFDVKNARWAEGRRLLVVDDVMTTGATLDACANVLRDAGAAAVVGLTVARG